MYSQENIDEVKKKYTKFFIWFMTATLVFIILIVLLCINWGTKIDPYRVPSVFGYIIGTLYAVFAVFGWNLVGSRLIKYMNFVKDMVTGLEHEVKANVQRVESTPILDNDLEFYQVALKTSEDEESRLVYLDASKDISQIKKGMDAKFLIHGKYIKEVIG